MTISRALPIRVALAALLLAVLAPAGRAQETAGVPVAARDLARGHVLTTRDIAWVEAGETTAAAAPVAEGWVTRRVIREGEPLRAPAVVRPDLVRAGQTVQAIWSRGNVELRLRGRALGAAAEGERVLIRIDTKRRVEGVAVGPALVRISPAS